MSRLLTPALLFALLAPACADGGIPSELIGESGGDGGEALSEPLPDELEEPTLLVGCELPVACEEPFEALREQGAVPGGSDGPLPGDRCAFAAMAAGDPALVQTVAAFGESLAWLDYVVVEPGVALRQASGDSATVGRWQKQVARCELQPPAFFAACAEQPSPACLDPEQWVVDCEDLDSLVCPR